MMSVMVERGAARARSIANSMTETMIGNGIYTGGTLTAYIVDSTLHAVKKYILCHTTAIECKLVLGQKSALTLLFGDSLQ